jgi:ankyrin repeat protein
MKKMMYASIVCGFLLFTKMSFAAHVVDVNRDLVAAAQKNDIKEVQDALKAGANVNASFGPNITALYWAVANGDTKIVSLLLEAGADVKAKHEGDLTAFMFAASMGRVDIVRLLLDRGADINARDNAGNTALELAENEQVKKVLCDFIDKLNS